MVYGRLNYLLGEFPMVDIARSMILSQESSPDQTEMQSDKHLKLFPWGFFPGLGYQASPTAFLQQEAHWTDLHPVADSLEHII